MVSGFEGCAVWWCGEKGNDCMETVSDTEEHRALWEPRRGGLCMGTGGKEQMAEY